MKRAQKKVHVVGAVITEGGKVLAARRGPGKAMSGFWEFPGGKIEPDESPKEALARELQEELLCTADVGDFIITTEHAYDFATIVLSTYFCTVTNETPQLTEHDEIRWLPASQLEDLEWAPADIPAVKLVVEALS